MFKRASFIIPARNEERHIGDCLRAIAALKSPPEIETIVIDNGSADRTVEIATACGATVLVKPTGSVSFLRNEGVRQSRGDLLAFVDADCVVAEQWLREGIAALERDGAGAAGNFYTIPDDTGWIGRINDLIHAKKLDGAVTYVPAGNLLVRRDCFEEIGGFDASLKTSEDVDLCRRLKQSGHSLSVNPAMQSVHYGTPSTVGQMFRRELWHGTTMLTVFFRDLVAIRNLRLALYTILNTVLLASLAASLWPLWHGRLLWSGISLGLYLALNGAVTVLDWTRIRSHFPGLFAYTIIYGLARSASLVRWIIVR